MSPANVSSPDTEQGSEDYEQEAVWASAQASASITAYQEYLNAYPKGTYAASAKKQIKSLKIAAAAEAIAKRKRAAAEAEAERKRAEEERKRVAAEAEEKLKSEAVEASNQLSAAKAGDINAMRKMVLYYDAGIGVRQDAEKAEAWRNRAESATAQKQLRAARSGDTAAMREIASRYDSGLGIEVDAAQANAWRQKAALQERAVRRETAIQNFSYFQYVDKNHNDLQNNSTAIITAPMATAFDLISLPTRTFEMSKIKNQAAYRPSTWGKPDSMIARATRQSDADGRKSGNSPETATMYAGLSNE
jgi:TPR repeat protein